MNRKKIIVVTGTPACGKTTIAKLLAKKLNAEYVDVNKIIDKNKLSIGYDKKRKSKIVDVERLNKILVNMIKNAKKDLVIDSHLAHYLDRKYVDLCVVTKCDIKVLKKRLKKRGYHNSKVRENIDAEIFDVCWMEAMALGHKVLIVDTTQGLDEIESIDKV